jgi:hypothetical protein
MKSIIKIISRSLLASGVFAACASTGSGPDEAAPDSGPKPLVDSGQPMDPVDASNQDAGRDANVKDSSVDARPDSSRMDASVVDARADAGIGPNIGGAIGQFETDMIRAICDRVTSCCGAATISRAKCEARFLGGFEHAAWGSRVVGVLKTRVLVDTAKRNACIAALGTSTCLKDGVPSAEQLSLVTQCLGAVSGTGFDAANCTHDSECGADYTCGESYTPATKMHVSAECTDVGLLSPCRVTDAFNGNSCSNQGSGDTGQFCNTAGACVPLLANGQSCMVGGVSRNLICASGACNAGVCAPTTAPIACTEFAP